MKTLDDERGSPNAPQQTRPRRRFPQVGRWILLALLAPLWAFALTHAGRYDQDVLGLAFSADGTELFVVRGRNDDRGRPVESSCEVQVWDVASGRLARSKVTGHGVPSPTGDGEHLVDFPRDGRIRLLSPASLEPVIERRLPDGLGQIRRVIVHGRLLVVASIPKEDLSLVMCIDLEDGRLLRQWTAQHTYEQFSRDGRQLIVSRLESSAANWTADAYRVTDDSLAPWPGGSIDGRVIATAPNGDAALVVGSPMVLYHLPTGATQPWRPPLRLGEPWAVFFSAEGKRLHSIHVSGKAATFDATTSVLVAERQLAGLSGPLLDYAVSPDGRFVAGTTDYRQVRIWELDSGKVVARLPDHRPMRLGLAAAYLAWCAAWVASGVRSKPARPWWDVILIHGVLLAVLLVHVAVRPRAAIHPAVIAVCLALLTGLLGMLTLWWIHGRLRWSLRLAGMVAGTAVVAAALLVSGHREDWGVWNAVLGAFSYLFGLALLLKSWRWRGLTVTRAADPTAFAPLEGEPRWQMPLKDLLLVTAAVGLLLGVMRFAVPGGRPLDVLGYLSAHGAALAVAVFVSTWAALSARPLGLRLGATCLLTALGGAVPPVAFAASGPNPLWWCELLHGVAAAAVWLSLGVFRLHGYRLAVRPSAL